MKGGSLSIWRVSLSRVVGAGVVVGRVVEVGEGRFVGMGVDDGVI